MPDGVPRGAASAVGRGRESSGAGGTIDTGVRPEAWHPSPSTINHSQREGLDMRQSIPLDIRMADVRSASLARARKAVGESGTIPNRVHGEKSNLFLRLGISLRCGQAD